ncbi:type VI secretion system tip protein VgrG [Lysobacter sp. MMG2]|uniref:type VI secretion system Vgr family protein n=1 Tax=Lysobacter sp. MMG2 TaxID=2801338 RepID=UPI001C21DF99|nr:type VI secretion system tip protein TssI/VgrG [Lysobacter sp. MMG2]MBU8975981.1 type VI secretion system tip protein VgrG [Lysobacter sp. MMG2]
MAARSEVRFTFEGGGSAFDVVRFELREGVSQPFRLELELSSLDDAIDATALLDRDATFAIARDGIVERRVHGIVTAFEQDETGFQRTRYRATVESPLARLGLRHGSRIFQQVAAPEILATLLKEHRLAGTRTAFRSTHEPREYCVQYRETDATFFHRIATEEGIVHWSEAQDGHGTLVLSDRIDSVPMLDGPVVYQPAPAGDAPGPHLWHVGYRRELAPTRLTNREYTFKNPRYDLQHEARAWAAEHAMGDYEHYDYAARYKRDEAGKPFTRSKLSGLRNAAEHARIEGDDARLWPGLAFDLIGHPTTKLNDRWRVISMRHTGEQATSQETDAADAEHGSRYRYEATVVPAHYDWKPEPAPRPVVDGPQIAHVVGPQGEEIHCDEHGRVQVWFPWDREGPRENATCWIRVSQGWAGAMYGFQAIPRIGHEVIVSFLEGDPDQPIVTGRAYHAANRPPYELPHHKTRTTFKTQTHKGEGYNELRFEDEAGQEEIFVHAQKDQNIVVEHDETTKVGHDRSEDVGNDETIVIGHDRTETVGNDETLSIGQDRRETLGRDHTIDIGRSRHVTIAKDLIEDIGNVRIEKTATDRKAETGGHYEHNIAGRSDIEAGQSITERTQIAEINGSRRVILRGPGGSITIDDSGIKLDALQIRLKGPVRIEGEGRGNEFTVEGTLLPAVPLELACPWGSVAAFRPKKEQLLPAASGHLQLASPTDAAQPAHGVAPAVPLPANPATPPPSPGATPTTAPPSPAPTPHECQWRIPSVEQTNCRMNMEGADYYMLDKLKNRVLDPTTRLPHLLRYSTFEGKFDLRYDEAAKVITATVRIKVVPKDMVELDVATGATPAARRPKLDSNGTPISVPFDSDKHWTQAEISNANHRKVDRPQVTTDLNVLADKITKTLNQDNYKLTIDGCPQGNGCSCLIPVSFGVELQRHDQAYAKAPHHTIEMYPRNARANAAAWGEECGSYDWNTSIWKSLALIIC